MTPTDKIISLRQGNFPSRWYKGVLSPCYWYSAVVRRLDRLEWRGGEGSRAFGEPRKGRPSSGFLSALAFFVISHSRLRIVCVDRIWIRLIPLTS